MPQLDQVSFLSQFFWLCFFFFGFYYLISKDFLPKMARILKLRKKKMGASGSGIQSVEQENERVRATSSTVVENGLSASGELLSAQFKGIDSWLTEAIADVNKKQLEKSNNNYIKWVVQNAIRQQIALEAAAPATSARIFTSILAEKCKNVNVKQPAARPGFQGKQLRPDSLQQPLTIKRKRSSGATSSKKGPAGKTMPSGKVAQSKKSRSAKK